MDIKAFESASLGVARIVVINMELVDGEMKETTAAYHLVLDFNALALALDKTGLDFSKSESWMDITPPNLLAVCWAAFHRFHPLITIEEVGRMLSPAQLWDVKGLLMDLAYPGWTERIAKFIEESKKQGEAANGEPPGEAQPAAESV